MKVIKFTITLTPQQLVEFANITEEQTKELLNVLSPYIWLVDTNKIETDTDVFYALTNEKGINNFVNYFINLGISVKVEDISKSIINGTFSDQIHESDLDAFNTIKEVFFQDYVEVDDILDKISECGIESLTELDKKVLSA
jgi:hypothetical protein